MIIHIQFGSPVCKKIRYEISFAILLLKADGKRNEMSESKKNQAHFQRYVQIEVYHVSILQLTTQQLEENCRTTSCQKSVEGVEGMAIDFCKRNPPQFTCTHAAMPS